jgi:tetratricopeptide (TPR) repeat protein
MPVRLGGAAVLLLAVACAAVVHVRERASSDPLAHALAPVEGDGGRASLEIARLQDAIRRGGASPLLLERLGWAFVARAREIDDDALYERAERCARALEARAPGNPGARLLRGHALVALHRFAEAEAIARPLAAERGLAADHGLLGDALLSQGRLAEAARAYQAMMDLRPDAQAYARAAELRWLTGDPEGAVRAMEVAARAASPRDAETFAWIWAELALHQLRSGALADAARSAGVALAAAPGSRFARYALGRVGLAEQRFADAARELARAAERAPLPEVLSSLAEALAEDGRADEARRAEQRLLATGEAADPRGLALFLLQRGRDLPVALRLLERELERRRDAETLAAYALARAEAGAPGEAWREMERALESGSVDPRLHLHAARVAEAAGRPDAAAAALRVADARRFLLLPSERRELARAFAAPEPHQEEP